MTDHPGFCPQDAHPDPRPPRRRRRLDRGRAVDMGAPEGLDDDSLDRGRDEGWPLDDGDDEVRADRATDRRRNGRPM